MKPHKRSLAKKKMVSKVENYDPKMPKLGKAKINPKLQFQAILIRKNLMLSKCYESTEVD